MELDSDVLGIIWGYCAPKAPTGFVLSEYGDGARVLGSAANLTSLHPQEKNTLRWLAGWMAYEQPSE